MKLLKESLKDFLNESISLSELDYSLIFKKLEYTFKKSNNYLIDKIKNMEQLTDEDLNLLLKKFEYSFRKSNPEIIERIKEYLGKKGESNIKYSNLKSHQKQLNKLKKEI